MSIYDETASDAQTPETEADVVRELFAGADDPELAYDLAADAVLDLDLDEFDPGEQEPWQGPSEHEWQATDQTGSSS